MISGTQFKFNKYISDVLRLRFKTTSGLRRQWAKL